MCTLDGAIDISSAVYVYIEAWKLEDGEVVEENFVESSEEYLKRCVPVVEDICEAVNLLIPHAHHL
jgi:hypothetical protein